MARSPREIDPNFPKGRLFGSVTCASTGLPLSGAAIKLQGVSPAVDEVFGLRKLGITDANGNFDFPAVLAWTYYIFSTLPGIRLSCIAAFTILCLWGSLAPRSSNTRSGCGS